MSDRGGVREGDRDRERGDRDDETDGDRRRRTGRGGGDLEIDLARVGLSQKSPARRGGGGRPLSAAVTEPVRDLDLTRFAALRRGGVCERERERERENDLDLDLDRDGTRRPSRRIRRGGVLEGDRDNERVGDLDLESGDRP